MVGSTRGWVNTVKQVLLPPRVKTQTSSWEVRAQALWAEAGKLISFSLFKLEKMASAWSTLTSLGSWVLVAARDFSDSKSCEIPLVYPEQKLLLPYCFLFKTQVTEAAALQGCRTRVIQQGSVVPSGSQCKEAPLKQNFLMGFYHSPCPSQKIA